MRIAIDAQLTVGSATGIGEYVRGLVPALREDGVEVAELRERRLDPWRFDRRLLWDQVLLPARASRSGASVLHCASGTVPLVCRLPVVATVHDVAWLRVQAHARSYARYYFGAFALARYRRCREIVTDSAFSRAELLDLVPEIDVARVHVVAPGVGPEFADVHRNAGDRRTVLVIGTVEPRKNLVHVVQLLPRLPGARLVSIGPTTPYLAECRALARRLGVAERVEFRGYVSREALLDLYATAAVAAVPSRYEGFGYAVAQALCAGIPCVASDRASLPEVAGGDGRIVALEDDDGWVAALSRALAGEEDARAVEVRARCVERFSWATAARAMRAIYARASVQ
ncbi:MAG TPA: glycosyltransferase family 1 protein [Candidatus Tyrphobacter sp.]